MILSFLVLFAGNKLVKLEVRNAWLSVDGLKLMLKLTSLTLVFIRLDDEDLEKVNECFPHLQFLSLMDVGGLKRPRIHLSYLKTLFWKVSNTPLSLTVNAPHLTELHLSCIEPELLSLETPHLSLLDLTIVTLSGDIKLGHFQNLINLRANTWDCSKFFRILNGAHTVKTLELNVPEVNVSTEHESSVIMISDFVDLFCGLEELKLVGAAKYRICGGNEHIKLSLKRLVIEVEEYDFHDFGAISEVMKVCTPCEVALLFRADMESSAASKKDVLVKYAQKFPEFRWR
jgi:hypothetical protein